jgi:hypothetical protein
VVWEIDWQVDNNWKIALNIFSSKNKAADVRVRSATFFWLRSYTPPSKYFSFRSSAFVAARDRWELFPFLIKVGKTWVRLIIVQKKALPFSVLG